MNPILPLVAVLSLLLCACGTVNVKNPQVSAYGVPVYEVGSGIPAEMSPQEAARVRGRVTMEELRHNRMQELP